MNATVRTLRIDRHHTPVTALGPGRRMGIWTQGCPLACRGCMSRDTWDPEGGTEIAITELLGEWRTALLTGVDGLTVSGGEPLAQPAGLAALLRGADEIRRAARRDADLLVYTGYELAELDAEQSAALELADAVITGRYEVTRPTRLIWRGSAGQRLIPRTPLGHRRYAPYLDHEPDRTPIQIVGLDEEPGIWLIGVPAPGSLAGLERVLRSLGAVPGTVTWRPGRRVSGEAGTPPR